MRSDKRVTPLLLLGATSMTNGNERNEVLSDSIEGNEVYLFTYNMPSAILISKTKIL